MRATRAKRGRARRAAAATARGAAAAAAALLFLVAGCAEEPAGGGSAAATDAPAEPTAADLDAALRAAETYLLEERLDEAERILSTLVKRAPSFAEGREMFGQLLMSRGIKAREAGDGSAASRFFGRAADEYDAVVELLPDVAGLRQSAGEIALYAGRSDRALAHFAEASRMDPENPKPPFLSAQILLERGEVEAAREAIERSLRLDPREPYARATLATIQMEAGEFDAARASIREARSLAPADLSLRVVHARIERRAGAPEAALNLLLPLGDEERANRAVTTEIAASLVDLNRHAEAAAAWAHRCRHAPGDWKAAVEAGEAYARAGEREVALSYHHLASLAAPDAPEVAALEALIRNPSGANDAAGGGA